MTNEELNESLKNMRIEVNGNARIVDLDDTIKFDCKRCGKCCSSRSDIMLNPYDVYRIAKSLNITTKEVIQNYCDVYPGNNSGLPIVTLKEDKRGLCPFLKFSTSDGKFGCSINDSKPGACIMHPIGVVRSVNVNNRDEHSKQFIEVPSCNVHGTETEVKIRDFIKPYLDNEECHEAGSLLVFEPERYVKPSEFINCLVKRDEESLQKRFSKKEIDSIKSLPEFISKASFVTYMGTTIDALYDIDTNKDFMEQVDEIKERIRISCLKMITAFRTINLDFSSGQLTKKDEELIKEITKNFEQGFEDFCEKLENEKIEGDKK